MSTYATSPQEQVLADMQAAAWPEPGDKMRFLNCNGYHAQLENARKVMNEGDILTVKFCSVSDWDHFVTFEETPGAFNGVMFESAAND